VTRISSARSASSSSLPKGKLLPHIFSFDRWFLLINQITRYRQSCC
jgi:hypothetical protein